MCKIVVSQKSNATEIKKIGKQEKARISDYAQYLTQAVSLDDVLLPPCLFLEMAPLPIGLGITV